MGVYTKSSILENEQNISESCVNPIQVATEIERMNHTIFEAVLEADFVEVQNSLGMLALTESDVSAIAEAQVEGIRGKVEQVIGAVVEFLKKSWENFLQAINKLTDVDGKLAEKYGKVLVQSNEKLSKCEKEIKIVDAAEYQNKRKALQDKVDKLTNVFATTFSVAKQAEDLPKVLAELEATAEKFTKTVKVNAIAADDFAFIVNRVGKGYKEFAKEEKMVNDECKKFMEHAKSKAASAKSDSKEGKDKDGVKSANDFAKNLNDAAKFVTKIEKINFGMTKKATSISRLAYIKLGRLASGAKAVKVEGEETTTSESVELMEAHDMLMELNHEAVMEAVFA